MADKNKKKKEETAAEKAKRALLAAMKLIGITVPDKPKGLIGALGRGEAAKKLFEEENK